MNQNNIFDKVEKKTGVKMDEILKIADSVKHANFKDEATVRNLIRRIGKVANRSVNKQTEDQIVDAIVNGSQPLNFDTIAKMLNNKR
ncbi:stage VI sporulation protein F [Alteribacillus bidgolensis]|uniref:Stage VI sporulation protein F n=1 Tax=Alteribacillus bidgolensis TaxID=930129 RepID=A0A1G8CVF4_9BACI|nr:stage VI sporulation protein F [Alteribacillus bidgolensis]SDH49517.1 Stage VI sporulation protein F [Alteribacillus bidgolensis]